MDDASGPDEPLLFPRSASSNQTAEHFVDVALNASVLSQSRRSISSTSSGTDSKRDQRFRKMMDQE